jgi:hypothetical protein
MPSPETPQPSAATRRPARDLIDAVIENMRRNLEPLKYSTLAPSRYVVYLHPREFARIEQIVPVLQAQTARALEEELAKLNTAGMVRRYASRFLGVAAPVENAARDWQIEFVADADGDLQEGDILIHSELSLPGAEALGTGQMTRRIATMHVGHRTTTASRSVTETRPASATVLARLRYEDDSGPHTFDIVRDTVTVGRGGQSHRVDLRLESSVDISREHLRIRRDAESGRFFVTDLSLLGTTVNGRRLAKGFDDVEGERRENGVETEITHGVRLGLADIVFMEFEVTRP